MRRLGVLNPTGEHAQPPAATVHNHGDILLTPPPAEVFWDSQSGHHYAFPYCSTAGHAVNISTSSSAASSSSASPSLTVTPGDTERMFEVDYLIARGPKLHLGDYIDYTTSPMNDYMESLELHIGKWNRVQIAVCAYHGGHNHNIAGITDYMIQSLNVRDECDKLFDVNIERLPMHNERDLPLGVTGTPLIGPSPPTNARLVAMPRTSWDTHIPQPAHTRSTNTSASTMDSTRSSKTNGKITTSCDSPSNTHTQCSPHCCPLPAHPIHQGKSKEWVLLEVTADPVLGLTNKIVSTIVEGYLDVGTRHGRANRHKIRLVHVPDNMQATDFVSVIIPKVETSSSQAEDTDKAENRAAFIKEIKARPGTGPDGGPGSGVGARATRAGFGGSSGGGGASAHDALTGKRQREAGAGAGDFPKGGGAVRCPASAVKHQTARRRPARAVLWQAVVSRGEEEN